MKQQLKAPVMAVATAVTIMAVIPSAQETQY